MRLDSRPAPAERPNNYDRFTSGLGGPTPVKGLTYYATYEGTWTDTYLKSGRSYTRSDFFDFIKMGNRQANSVNANFKLAYTKVPWKLTFESINNPSENSPYYHQWSRSGYVAVTYDTTYQNGSPIYTPRYGRWSFYPEDSTFKYYNAADHTPTIDTRFHQLKSVWTHSLSKTDVYTVRPSDPAGLAARPHALTAGTTTLLTNGYSLVITLLLLPGRVL